MGNRANVKVYVKNSHFTKGQRSYWKSYVKLYEKLYPMKKKNAIKEMNAYLLEKAPKVFDKEDFIFLDMCKVDNTPLSCDFKRINGDLYICNTKPFGEFNSAEMDRKNKIPTIWLFLFKLSDKIDKKVVMDKTYPAYAFSTTVKEAKANLTLNGGDSQLLEWLVEFPDDSIIELDYCELYCMVESFDEKRDVIDMMKSIEKDNLYKQKISLLEGEGYYFHDEAGQWINETLPECYFRGITKHLIDSTKTLEEFIEKVRGSQTFDVKGMLEENYYRV